MASSALSSPTRPQVNSNASLWGAKSTKDMFSNRFAPSKGTAPVTIRVQSREAGLKVDAGCTISDIRERLKLSFDIFAFYMNGREVEHISEAFLIVSSTNSFEILYKDGQNHSADVPEVMSNSGHDDSSTRALCLAMGDNVFATFTKGDGTHEFRHDIEELIEEGIIKEKHVPRELPRTSVKRLDRLGGGAFGDVFKGYLEEPNSLVPPYLVAIKCLKGSPTPWERKEFLREAAIMAQIRHKNIVSLVGVVTKGEPYMLLLQFCEHGSLDIFLRNHTGMLDLSLIARLQISRDVCEGCSYLSDNGFIHRDIAARNVLVASDWTCKLADFGLSKSMNADEEYVQGDKGRIPIRWSSTEVLEDGRFSEKSDVWAFGVVLYEIFSRGQTPYKGISNNDVWRRVCGGYRLERPANTPDSLYELMMDTWDELAKRPTFKQLLPRIQAMYNEEAKKEALQYEQDGVSLCGDNSELASGMTTLDSMGSVSMSRTFSMSQSLSQSVSRSFSVSQSPQQSALSRSMSMSQTSLNLLNKSLSSSQHSLILPQQEPVEHEYVYNDCNEASSGSKQVEQEIVTSSSSSIGGSAQAQQDQEYYQPPSPSSAPSSPKPSTAKSIFKRDGSRHGSSSSLGSPPSSPTRQNAVKFSLPAVSAVQKQDLTRRDSTSSTDSASGLEDSAKGGASSTSAGKRSASFRAHSPASPSSLARSSSVPGPKQNAELAEKKGASANHAPSAASTSVPVASAAAAATPPAVQPRVPPVSPSTHPAPQMPAQATAGSQSTAKLVSAAAHVPVTATSSAPPLVAAPTEQQAAPRKQEVEAPAAAQPLAKKVSASFVPVSEPVRRASPYSTIAPASFASGHSHKPATAASLIESHAAPVPMPREFPSGTATAKCSPAASARTSIASVVNANLTASSDTGRRYKEVTL